MSPIFEKRAVGMSSAEVRFKTIFGVDFSGAKLAGRNIWIAAITPVLPGGESPTQWKLTSLDSLENLCGCPDRDPALAYLVDLIRQSTDALWAMDFPFSLPIEILPEKSTWLDQLEFLRNAPGAQSVGYTCLDRARALGGKLHIRRQTDTEAKTPFDCYHYRIIYQYFHGVRDVLGPLWSAPATATLPFQYAKLARASRVLVEACPSSTLKRLNLPHQNYKQPAGGPLALKCRKTRQTILEALARHVDFDAKQRRTLMRNPGGDAIDAVLAAIGGAHAWNHLNHRRIARHKRYPREGMLYV